MRHHILRVRRGGSSQTTRHSGCCLRTGMRATLRLELWALAISTVLGCSKAPVSPPVTTERATDASLPSGVVRVAPQSLPFLKTQAVQVETALPALRVPARVAFREGSFSQLSAPLSGRVVQVHVNSGDRVKMGDSLVTLNCPEASSARSQLATAEAELREAQAALTRETTMLAKGVGTERDRLAAEIKLASERAEYQRALETARFVGAGQGSIVILRAPLDGVILSRRTTVGAAVSAGGDPLIELGDPQALWIIADVFERDLSLIRVGLQARTELTSLAHPVEGQVISIGTVVSEAMRTAPVRIACVGDVSGLRPGMFGRAQIVSDESGIALPARAVLIREGGETVVYVGRDSLLFEQRKVIVGPALDGRVRVLSGLRPSEKVVVEGALLLDGAAEQLL